MRTERLQKRYMAIRLKLALFTYPEGKVAQGYLVDNHQSYRNADVVSKSR